MIGKRFLLLVFVVVFSFSVFGFSCEEPANSFVWAGDRIVFALDPLFLPESWVEVYFDKPGDYRARFTNSGVADIEVGVYGDCGRPLLCFDRGTEGTAACRFSVPSKGYYKVRVKTNFEDFLHPLYYLYLEAPGCNGDDVYWYNYHNGFTDKKQECGEDYCEDWGANFCSSDGNVTQSKPCFSRGCFQGSCTQSLEDVTERVVNVCSDDETCLNGSCDEIECRRDLDCGRTRLIGSGYCFGGDVYRDRVIPKCENRATVDSFCSESFDKDLVEECGVGSVGNWSEAYCDAGNIVRQRQVVERGCDASIGSCFDNGASREVDEIERCQYGCDSVTVSCKPPAPNFEVLNVQVDDSQPVQGETNALQFSVTVRNKGTEGTSYIGGTVNTPVEGICNTESKPLTLREGEIAILNLNWEIPTSYVDGDYNFTAKSWQNCVDSAPENSCYPENICTGLQQTQKIENLFELVIPSCRNNVWDAEEEGIDCGGQCGVSCLQKYGGCTPLLTHGDASRKVDIAFFPDRDYQQNFAQFRGDVNNIIRNVFDTHDQIRPNFDMFNFYYTEAEADALVDLGVCLFSF